MRALTHSKNINIEKYKLIPTTLCSDTLICYKTNIFDEFTGKTSPDSKSLMWIKLLIQYRKSRIKTKKIFLKIDYFLDYLHIYRDIQ